MFDIFYVICSIIPSRIDQYLFLFKVTFLWLFSRIRYFARLYLTSLLSRWIWISLLSIQFSQKGCYQFSYLLQFLMVYAILVPMVGTRKKLNNWQRALLLYLFWVSFPFWLIWSFFKSIYATCVLNFVAN